MDTRLKKEGARSSQIFKLTDILALVLIYIKKMLDFFIYLLFFFFFLFFGGGGGALQNGRLGGGACEILPLQKVLG